MTMTDIATTEQRIAERINSKVAGGLPVSTGAGGLAFVNMDQTMEFAKLMAISSVAVPRHLRSNPGACLAIVIQAIEWKMSPYAVANKSYSVNDRLAYESQLVQAVILQRAPIVGRFKVEYTGDGDNRICKVWAKLKDSEDTVEYISPPFGKITPKNSPLWKSDPDQQQFYYSGRALCRRHFPDVLLGVYADDEILPPGPDSARDVTPAKSIGDKLDALAGVTDRTKFDPETGEITETTQSDGATTPPSPAAASEAGPAPSGPATASTQQPEPAAPGQAAADPPKDKAAAVGPSPFTSLPKTEKEYFAYAATWINELTDIEEGEARWKAEKNLRNKCNVGAESREELQERLAQKCKEIRNSDHD
jgi:hypothetical protein